MPGGSPQPCCCLHPGSATHSLTGPASPLLAGKSLKTLMSKGILQVHPPICDCPGCRISSPVVRCGKQLGFGAFFLSRGACAYFVGPRILTSTLPVCRRELPGATLLGVGILGTWRPHPFGSCLSGSFSLGVSELLFLSPGNTPGCEVPSLESRPAGLETLPSAV